MVPAYARGAGLPASCLPRLNPTLKFGREIPPHAPEMTEKRDNQRLGEAKDDS